MHPWTRNHHEVYCSAEDAEKWFALEEELTSKKEDSHYPWGSPLREKLEYVGWVRLLGNRYSTNKDI